MNLLQPVAPERSKALVSIASIGFTFALCVAGAVLLIYQAVSLRASLTNVVRLQAEMISESIAFDLEARNKDAAAEILKRLSRMPYVESVGIYDANDVPFIRYAQEGAAAFELNEATPTAAERKQTRPFEDVIVSRRIYAHDKTIGTTVLVAKSDRMEANFERYAIFLLAAAACSLWAARLVTSRMNVRVQKAERNLAFVARTDPLTRLLNRPAFHDELARRLEDASQADNALMLILIDLDNFKSVNDTSGYRGGDELLRRVSNELTGAVAASGLVSRICGDEFAVLTSGSGDGQQSHLMAQSILGTVSRAIELAGHSNHVTASVGYSRYPDDASDVASLMSCADTALHAAKALGANAAVAFRLELTTEARRRARLELDLRDAIEHNRLEVHYQPQFDCRAMKLVGAEALLRWNHSTEGPIPPSEFVAIAEASDLIVSLGRWVMRKACQDAVHWNRIANAPINVAVNVSATQLRDARCEHWVSEALAESGLPAERLELELTESQLMANVSVAVETLERLRSKGIRISIDDFGTGYSSLSYLQAFPVSQLKIDRSFIASLPNAGQPIVSAIIAMARNFGLTVVAEGVEHRGQLEWLMDAGCDVVQGYLTGRPMDFAGVMTLVDDVSRPTIA